MPKASTTPAPLPQIKPSDLHRFHAALGAWYGANGRHHLPWRQTDDAYPIWVSEVMLQQTQVATVLERFYFPFLKTFPTIQHLAQAPREKVMKAWEGLGYYRRAGFLHEAAKRAHNGLPADEEALAGLPGIGRNTARAVLAFAYRQPVAIMEANVKRIVARIFALENPSDVQLWAGADMLLNHAEPFDHNQAMMDIGSMVCTPKTPQCPVCPANSICKGKVAPERYPTPKVKKVTPTREVVIHVQEDNAGRLYLTQRSDALLGGLWGFPQYPSSVIARRPEADAAIQTMVQVALPSGLPRFARNDVIGEVVHVYSHFRLEGTVVLQTHTTRGSGDGWFTREQISQLPLSGVDHKVLKLMDTRHTPALKPKKTTARRAQH